MENNTANSAPDNSQVKKLWKDFEAAHKADRPQKQLDILQEIKRIASKERLPWDFYRAGEEFVNVSSSRNWKLVTACTPGSRRTSRLSTSRSSRISIPATTLPGSPSS